MLTSIRGFAAATALAAALAPTPGLAQEVEQSGFGGGLTVSGNVAVVSDYRFRGVSLSGGDLAVQGGIDLAHQSGFYLGTWASSIDDGGTDAFGDLELDLYGGWSGKVAEGVSVEVGLLYYAYPTNDGAFDPVNYWEPYASIRGTLGPVEATAGGAYAWDQDALGGDDNLYLYTDLGSSLPGTPVSLAAHLGYTDGALAPPLLAGAGDDSGFDWSLGAHATVLGGLDLGVSYVGVEGPSIDGFTDDTVVVSIGASF
jgi:uncharacterized protein (TIGR02001 family)